MTLSLALAHSVLAATKSSSSGTSTLLTFIPLIAIGLLGYFFFIKPQQRKQAAARAAQGSGYEVGDEVQTVGGVVGTILEIHGDRYTVLTGALADDGNLDGPQPTRIVFVRQAIAKKVDRVEDVAVEDDEVHDIKGASRNGKGDASSEVEDDSPSSTGDHGSEAEEA
jgi:preprotein translocase YajC subunit